MLPSRSMVIALAVVLGVLAAGPVFAQEAPDKETAAKVAEIRELVSKAESIRFFSQSEKGEARVAGFKSAASLLEIAAAIAQTLPRAAAPIVPAAPFPEPPPIEVGRDAETIRELLRTAESLEERAATTNSITEVQRYKAEAKDLRERAVRLLEGGPAKVEQVERLAAEVKELRAQVKDLRALVEKLTAELREKKPAAEPR